MSNLREVSSNAKTVVLGLTVDQDTADLIRQRARDSYRSVSSELRRALIEGGYLAPEHDRDHRAATT